MSVTLNQAVEQLVELLQVIADSHELGLVKQVFMTADVVQSEPGVYLNGQGSATLQWHGSTATHISGGTLVQHCQIIVSEKNFATPLEEMPANLRTVMDEILTEVQSRNKTNISDTTKAKFTVPNFFYGYLAEEDHGILDVVFETDTALAS